MRGARAKAIRKLVTARYAGREFRWRIMRTDGGTVRNYGLGGAYRRAKRTYKK